MNKTIVLIGLSGTGKSTAGAWLARALNRPFVDTDQLIEQEAGRSIADIFREQGEPEFRRIEARAFAKAVDQTGAVVATGGGIVEHPDNERLLRDARVVWLSARPAALAARLSAHSDRPLLQGDPIGALTAQAERRTPRYAALADWIVATDHLTAEQTAAEIRRFLDLPQAAASDALMVTTPGGSYEVRVAPDALADLQRAIHAIAPRGRVWIVSDDQVWRLHGERLLEQLRSAGIAADAYRIPAGEASKNLGTVSAVYDWLLGQNVERGDLLVAVGGGVVGDLAGFVAATVLRGIRLIQVPTTVLAIVDSSIGGKTGVDHPAGKNLVGAFHQPALVLADSTVLATLPPTDRQAGWAEAIKHGVIADAELFDDLVQYAPDLRVLSEPVTSQLLRRAAAVKVAVVSGDEREQGARILLNYGHTIGHALERWSNYTLRHGEGVAIGMRVAARIAQRLGIFEAALEKRLHEVLHRFELPTHLPPGADPTAILQDARSDKKVRQQRINWVLPTAIGSATVRNDVPDELVIECLSELAGG